MSKKPIHTVPNPTGGWSNKQDGNVVSNHEKKVNAEDKGRQLARQQQTEHVIHKKDGTIGEKNSYGSDTNPPKDKNK